LDHKFVDLYLSIDPELRIPRVEDSLDKSDIKVESTKRKIEKWLLRKSFDNFISDEKDKSKKTWLPGEVLWRKKEAFSDGVSSKEKSWYQIIQENVESLYSDSDFEKKEYQEPKHIKPYTKEALHYRTIFNKLFSTESANNVIPYFWLPKWSGNVKDPSARVLSVYNTNSK
jgi:asparagine synthase (glutamine-hydrolysing)